MLLKSDNHNDRKRVCHNDFVINSRSDRKGSSGLSELEGSVSLHYIVLKPKNIYPKFSEYLFKSKDFVEETFEMVRVYTGIYGNDVLGTPKH